MTLAQIEERLTALETAFAQLQAQQSRANGTAPVAGEEKTTPGEEEIIPGTEYVVVLNKPPTKTIPLRGIIKWIRRGPQRLGLSEEEWANLGLEEINE